MHARHLRLVAELKAKEAKEAGISAAEIVSPPKEKVSLGKVGFFLLGIGAVTYYLAFGKSHPFEEKIKEQPKKDMEESKALIEKIKLFQMQEFKEITNRCEPNAPSLLPR
jgi:hypothetical protein